MPNKPPPDPPAQATPKELQEYLEKMKKYAKQLEEETKKEKNKNAFRSSKKRKLPSNSNSKI